MLCKEHQCAKFNYLLEREGKCVGCFLKQKKVEKGAVNIFPSLHILISRSIMAARCRRGKNCKSK